MAKSNGIHKLFYGRNVVFLKIKSESSRPWAVRTKTKTLWISPVKNWQYISCFHVVREVFWAEILTQKSRSNIDFRNSSTGDVWLVVFLVETSMHSILSLCRYSVECELQRGNRSPQSGRRRKRPTTGFVNRCVSRVLFFLAPSVGFGKDFSWIPCSAKKH